MFNTCFLKVKCYTTFDEMFAVYEGVIEKHK